MYDYQKAQVRFIFQHVISTQHKANHDHLYAALLQEYGDEQDAQEAMESWQVFEGWIASHGLERAR